MNEIKQHLVESDLIQMGNDKANCLLQFISPEKTLVVMDYIDTDTFGLGFVEKLGIDKAFWIVLWQHVMLIPNAGEAATTLHSYRSTDAIKPTQACIIHALDDNHARLRGKIFKALDHGIDLSQCYIISPWMTESDLNEIEEDFGFSFPRDGITLVGTDRLEELRAHYAQLIETKAELHIPRIVWSRVNKPFDIIMSIVSNDPERLG